MEMLGKDTRDERNKKFIKLLGEITEMLNIDEITEDEIIEHVYNASGIRINNTGLCALEYAHTFLCSFNK